MLSELLRKKYRLKNHFMELEESDYEDLKDHLRDNFSDSKEGLIILTRLIIRYPNNKTEDYVERVIKDLNYLVYFTDIESQSAIMVYFEGDFRNEVITRHNEKVLTFIKRLDEINKDLEFRYNIVKNNKNLEKKELELGNMYPNTYTMVLRDLLNDLLDKTNYVFGGTYDERTNTVLYANPDFNKVTWSLEQRQDFMRSLFLDLPIGIIYINAFDYFMLSDDSDELIEYAHIDTIVYDGKNRLSSILYFLLGEFSVDFNGEEYFAGNLSKSTLKELLNKKITVYETDFQTKEELLTFYNMIDDKN